MFIYSDHSGISHDFWINNITKNQSYSRTHEGHHFLSPQNHFTVYNLLCQGNVDWACFLHVHQHHASHSLSGTHSRWKLLIVTGVLCSWRLRCSFSYIQGFKPATVVVEIERGVLGIENKMGAKRHGQRFLLRAIRASRGEGYHTHTGPPSNAGLLSRSGTLRLAQLAVPEHTGHNLSPPVPISTHAHHIQIHQALLAR